MRRIWLSKFNEEDFQGIGSPLDAIIDSLDDFYQHDITGNNRKDVGIEAAFLDVFPVVSDTISLDYIGYRIAEPELSEKNAKRYEKTRTATLYATLNRISKDRDGIKAVEETEARIGNILVPCENAPTFIVGGHERIVVPQLRRSPGLFLEQNGNETTATLMPKKGSWLVIGKNNGSWTFAASRRGKKHELTLLLLACGFSPASLIRKLRPESDYYKLRRNPNGGIQVGEYSTSTKTFSWENNIGLLPLCNKFLANDIYNGDGVLIGRTGRKTDALFLSKCWKEGAGTLKLVNTSQQNNVTALFTRFCEEYAETEQADAIIKVYSAITGRKTGYETKQAVMGFYNMFFNPRTCVISREGQKQISGILGLDEHEDMDEDSAVTKDLLIECALSIQAVTDGRKPATDIYGLENRRLRLPGEMLRDCLERGLRDAATQARKNAEDKEKSAASIAGLWNQRLVTLEMSRFSTGELCQLVDSYNPLTKSTHAMRFSALGEGGILGGQRGGAADNAAKLQVPETARYVHDSHYGRLSPLGPEGENVGLVGPLAVNVSVDENGFVSYPVWKVENGVVSDTVEWLSPFDDNNAKVAYGDTLLDPDNQLPEKTTARVKTNGAYRRITANADSVTHMDLSPAQCLSLESSLIPFIAHNDATRSAIASSQIRQAVPTLKPSSPMVGTGWENTAARISNAFLSAKRAGTIVYADSERVTVLTENNEIDMYNIPSYLENSDNGRWRPAVFRGDIVREDDVVVESASSNNGELSIGQNVQVAFMTWHGYNFEDAIVVSERLVASEAFTSLHIKELRCKVKETPFGAEETTDDLPNVAQSTLRGLNENGIAVIGSHLSEGDIVVGKATPRDPSTIKEMAPEEKLLRVVTGDWSPPIRDTSLRVPRGVSGMVVNMDILLSKDEEMPETEKTAIIAFEDLLDREITVLENCLHRRFSRDLLKTTLSSGEKITKKILRKTWAWELVTANDELNQKLDQAELFVETKKREIEKVKSERRAAAENGIKLESGVLQEIRVKLACRRALQIGDKMAGRHGNKGVVSIVVPTEDMPYDKETGEPVDMILSPLGVPSRMNIGQVLETHLGLALGSIERKTIALMDENKEKSATKKLRRLLSKVVGDDVREMSDMELWEMAYDIKDNGLKCAVPPFGGTSEDVLDAMLLLGNERVDGKRTLVDGQTGRDFDQPVTVGTMYMMKLHHMADTKMHARSTGPYNRITQQPVRGTALGGGQRLGEMEVWALEAYGAAYTLQEMLTIKSDDVVGRNKALTSIIVDGEPPNLSDILALSSVPEGTGVLFRELSALGLDIGVVEKPVHKKETKHEETKEKLERLFKKDETKPD